MANKGPKEAKKTAVRFIAAEAGRKAKDAVAQVAAEIIQDEMSTTELSMFRQVFMGYSW